jgi:hypothetical protein
VLSRAPDSHWFSPLATAAALALVLGPGLIGLLPSVVWQGFEMQSTHDSRMRHEPGVLFMALTTCVTCTVSFDPESYTALNLLGRVQARHVGGGSYWRGRH